MKIIVYPQIHGVGGIARYLQCYLQASGTAASDTVVVTGDFEQREVDLGGARLIVLPMGTSRFGLLQWSWRMRSVVRRLCAEHPGSVINLHIPPLLPGLFLPKVAPLVVTAHTTYLGMSGEFYQPRQFDSQWSWLSVQVKKWFERIIFAKADALLTLTEQGKQELLRYRQDKPIDLVPNGVDAAQFTPDATVAKDVDVLFAGRIERRKGSRPMVAVCKALVAAKPDIRISIVGYGDDMDFVTAELAPLAPAVTLHGKVPFAEVLQHYRRSKVYASTSYYEGLPGTCLEAMAVGLPAVVWNYLFYDGVVVPSINGVKVAPNATADFCGAVLALLGDNELIEKMGSAGVEIARRSYAWSGIATSIDAILGSA